MSDRKMFDIMVDAFAEARVAGRTPLNWTINFAAERDLLMDERVYRSLNPRKTIREMPFLGIPLAVEDDRGSQPGYILTCATPDSNAHSRTLAPDSSQL